MPNNITITDFVLFYLLIVFRFGGVLLHEDRFKHINNVARILLQESGIGLPEKAMD